MYYGWYIVGGVFTAQLFLTGFFTYAFSLFVVPIQETFDASRTEVMYSMTMATVLGLVTAPVIGAMVDRYSVRWLMTAGAILLGGGLLLMAQSQSVYQFAIIFGVSMSVANLLLGPLTGSTTISRWFSESRGRALGISATGTSIGGMLIPALVAYWLAQGDWRSTLENLAYCILLIVLPLMVLVMRGQPEPSDEETQNAASDDSEGARIARQNLSMGEILRHRAFWAIGLSIGLLFCVYSALLANLTPFATGVGVAEARAASLIMVVSLSGLIGKLIFGMAADRINLRVGLWMAEGLVVVGLLLYALEPGYPLLLAASVLIGLAAGGMLPVWGALLAAIFGVVSYGRVMGLMMPLITLLVMPGYAFAGFMYDLTGGYQLCFLIFVGILVVAALLLLLLRLPKVQVPAAAG